jgi:integrase
MTIKIDLVAWKAFMNYCLKRKYIREKPFKLYSIKKPQGKLVYLSIEEVKELQEYECESKPWLNKFLNLALLTGFRRGELRTLAWENIQPHRIIVVGKSGSREFPMNDRITELLNSIERKGPWVFFPRGKPNEMLH